MYGDDDRQRQRDTGEPFTCWEQIYGITNCALCDGNSSYTGDGMSNTNKFLAGFNPTNSAAYLHMISIAKTNGNSIEVTYFGANGDSTSPVDTVSRTNVLEFTTGTANGSYPTTSRVPARPISSAAARVLAW